MADIFREVDEDLRRDRMQRLWERYGALIVGAAVLIVAATAGYVLWQRWQASEQEQRTAVLLQAVAPLEVAEGATPDTAAAIAALDAAAGQLDGAHATLARLRQAGLLAREGNTADAVAIYDQVAGMGGADPLFRDLAQLLAVLHQLDGGDPAQLQARLSSLMDGGNPWRFSARELSALLAVRAGDTARAATLFRELSEDADTPAGIRARATELAAFYAVPR